ncbi:MAG TPA: DNA-binding response regulator [Ruminococcaceae bacterium]|jgi:DNA-binding response OmpR family regulator|nr:DNA-binding response regulator [Oscillospiraceae bacterium]
MKRVLVCEDEASIREFVVINLKRAGYEVIEAGSGEDALKLYDQQSDHVDVALLDIMLPGMDGFAVCRELRQRNDNIGIIILTARTQEMEKVGGLMMGADDYVTKPFSPSELVARVDALHRRVVAARARESVNFLEKIVSGDFELNLRNRTLKKQGQPVELTQVEFQIVEYFLSNEGKALSRTDILNRVWGEEYFGEEKIVDVNIRRLRMKIEDDPSEPRHILTVWGLGYKWVG